MSKADQQPGETDSVFQQSEIYGSDYGLPAAGGEQQLLSQTHSVDDGLDSGTGEEADPASGQVCYLSPSIKLYLCFPRD